MEDQLDQILKEKILSAVESPLPELTRRAVELPAISNKALAVIGMRRAGKTSFLHQCRGDLMAQSWLETVTASKSRCLPKSTFRKQVPSLFLHFESGVMARD